MRKADNERPVVRSITEARSYVDVSTGDDELAEIVADVGPERRAQIIDAAHDIAADIRIDIQRLGAAVIDDKNSDELEVLHLLPPQTFRQGQAWRHSSSTPSSDYATTPNAGVPPYRGAPVKRWRCT